MYKFHLLIFYIIVALQKLLVYKIGFDHLSVHKLLSYKKEL